MKRSTLLSLVGVAATMVLIGTALGSIAFQTTKIETITSLTTVTSTQIVTDTESINYSNISIAFVNHLLSIGSQENKSLIMNMYFSNATMVVEGVGAQGLQGTYDNRSDIASFLQGLSGLQNRSLTFANFSDAVYGNSGSVNSTLILNGVSKETPLYLPYFISVEVNYKKDSGTWLISSEIWNFRSCENQCD